jgi:antibiotic biosynthesis monooxygenase (ABM) superfamily enzyme
MLHTHKRLHWVNRLFHIFRKHHVVKTYSYMHLREQNKPPRYKVFLLTWLAIYPLITGIFLLLGKHLSLLPLPLRTLLLTGVLVYLMTYIVMPWLMKVFSSWLYPTQK